MEQKSNKGLIIVLVIFISICLGLIGYIAYDNGMLAKIMNKSDVKEEKKESVKKEEAKELDINSRLVQSLYNKISSESEESTWDTYWIYQNPDNDFNMEEDFNIETSNETIKMQIVYSNLANKNKLNINCNEYKIPDYQNDYYSLCYAKQTMNFTDDQAAYSKDYIESVYKSIFGSKSKLDTSVPMRSNFYGLPTYYYIPDYDMYFAYRAELGGVIGTGGYTSKLEKATQKEEQIKLYEKVEKYGPKDDDLSTLEEELEDTFTFIYTFEQEEDGMYAFISRVKES